jgi:hypothetical protein
MDDLQLKYVESACADKTGIANLTVQNEKMRAQR